MKKVIIILAFAVWSLNTTQSKIIMQSYLQALSDTSVIVMVECDSKNEVYVKYGNHGALSNTAKTDFYIQTKRIIKTYVHRIILNKLNPNTEYQYRAVQHKSFSSTFTFKTAVRPGAKFRFAVMGDCRSNPVIHNQIAKEIQRHKPLFSVYLGDLCYNSSYITWKKEFFVKEELKLSSSVPFFNAVGNHEGWEQNTMAFQQSPTIGKENNPYYSFEIGDVCFIIINNEESVKKGSKQYLFVKDVLDKTKKKWRIAAYHVPAYSTGTHGEDSEMIDITKEVFEPSKVDLTLAGHNHFYQHNYVNEIRHFIFGGGGAPLYNPKNAKYTIKSSMAYSYAIFDVQEDKILIRVYDIGGNVIDKVEITKNEVPDNPKIKKTNRKSKKL